MSTPPKVHLDRDGRARCNNPGARLLGTGQEVTCARCLNIMNGINHGGIQPLDQKPHGTRAAYRRHLRREGAPVRCESCLQAERRGMRDFRHSLRRAA